MDYETVRDNCHVRSGIYRTGDPVKIYTKDDLERLPDFLKKFNKHKVGTVVRKIYWKNYPIKLDDQIPDEDKKYNDWKEYDPKEH
ncbi:MAG: hypothetical protein ACP6IQ_02665 [Candidatus Njordarchaeia archaeon]